MEPWNGRDQIIVSYGCVLSLNLCRRGFQDLFKARPSSLFMLCGCIASLSRKNFVSFTLMMLCYATADLSVCANLICLVYTTGV